MPRATSTRGISLKVRGMGKEAFTMLVVRSTQENGGTIRNTERLAVYTVVLSGQIEALKK